MKTHKILAGLTALLAATCAAFAQGVISHSISLQWNSNSETNLGGYRLYFSQTSNVWSHVSLVATSGLPTASKTIALPNAGRWFFVVTATNTSGLESGFSNMVTYETPNPPEPPTGLVPTGASVTQVSTTVSNIVYIP